MVEYALLISLISVIALGATRTLGKQIADKMCTVSGYLGGSALLPPPGMKIKGKRNDAGCSYFFVFTP